MLSSFAFYDLHLPNKKLMHKKIFVCPTHTKYKCVSSSANLQLCPNPVEAFLEILNRRNTFHKAIYRRVLHVGVKCGRVERSSVL
jgi:hypothetical protein